MESREIRLRLPDGSERRVPAGTTALQVAQAIGPRLAQAALAAKVNGELVDLDRPILEDAEIRILTFADEEGRAVFRHSSTHVMAQAVKRLWPEAKLGTGPALEDGFYYDIDLPHAPSEEDLARIEAEMRRIVEADYPIEREEWPREKARAFFLELNEPYKVEIIDELPPDATISVYKQGEFVDLCRGPHVPSTGRIRHFKLLSVAGAYWRAKEGNPVLQRLYGTSFERKEDLDHFLWAR
ncbi:MAG: TGS domain-containing protein, partial [Clostridia bacterium]|nr:TGS domain-containing protein [Clostridia bacterium]